MHIVNAQLSAHFIEAAGYASWASCFQPCKRMFQEVIAEARLLVWIASLRAAQSWKRLYEQYEALSGGTPEPPHCLSSHPLWAVLTIPIMHQTRHTFRLLLVTSPSVALVLVPGLPQ